MTRAERMITFRAREFKGSRLRCLLLTSAAPTKILALLNSLVAPHALVTMEDYWAPRGFLNPDEAKLGKTLRFLSAQHQKSLTSWWLVKSGRSNTPNWDLVSECHINKKQGLILIESKAHEGEFSNDSCDAKKNSQNYQQIENALSEATTAWNTLLISAEVALSAKRYYQLSNRFAFAWKLAKMGIPVVLIYLGFLNAYEMEDGKRTLLRTHEQWRDCVLMKSQGIIPLTAWDNTFDVNGTPLTVLIRSAEVRVETR